MKYGGDKIKVVTDGLNKGDDLQALTFDTCGYLLIGKWDNKYGTQGEPLMSDEVPCGSEANCPNCQPKITDVLDLPGRPDPCDGGDAFLMLSNSGNLKVLCKDNFICKDEKVKTSSGDGTPGYLIDKLKACDSNGPITVQEVSNGNNHNVCIGFDKSKVKMDIIDLDDGPGQYPSNKGLLVGSSSGWNWLTPNTCSNKRYSYLVYDSDPNSQTFTTICEKDTSLVDMWLKSDYDFEFDIGTTQSKNVEWSGDNIELWSTDDINKGSGTTMFEITRPGIYLITLNLTFMNETEAWLKAVRAGITQDGVEVGDAKYDSRYTSSFINEEYPGNFINHQKSGREIDLRIMSFCTAYVLNFKDASVNNPVKIGIAVKVDTQIADPRHTGVEPDGKKIKCKLTSGIANEGAKTRLSAARIGDIPKSFDLRT